MIQELVDKLYVDQPSTTLFHYTSLAGLVGMVENRSIWASDVRYLNDAEELDYFGKLIREYCLPRQEAAEGFRVQVYRQLMSWIKTRFSDGPYIFVASFTENGNLLSQWRGYCQHGSGLSVGFDPTLFTTCVRANGFLIGKCIYDLSVQRALASEMVARLMGEAEKNGPDGARPPSECYWTLFSKQEAEILTVAALVKHPSFVEESEWRCVSKPLSRWVDAPILYRVGKSALVPYLELPLPVIHDGVAVSEVYVGPTVTPNLSMKSISSYLSKCASVHTRLIVRACNIPYQG